MKLYIFSIVFLLVSTKTLVHGQSDDSLKISRQEAIEYLMQKRKLNLCMATVDSLVFQTNDLTLQRDEILKREKEVNLQLNLEKAKARRKNWIIGGYSVGGVALGFLLGFLIAK